MRILIFILLCSSFKIIFNLAEIKYNEETKVEKERKLKENVFIFFISKSFNKNNKIHIDISYKGNEFSIKIDKLFYIEGINSIDDIKNFDSFKESVLPDKEPKCESGDCSYKYVIELSEDAKVIPFRYKLLKSLNVDYIKVKIYQKNYLWIILLCAGLGIALLWIGIGLYFCIKNNKRKISVINEPLSAEDTKDEPVFQENLETTQY